MFGQVSCHHLCVLLQPSMTIGEYSLLRDIRMHEPVAERTRSGRHRPHHSEQPTIRTHDRRAAAILLFVITSKITTSWSLAFKSSASLLLFNSIGWCDPLQRGLIYWCSSSFQCSSYVMLHQNRANFVLGIFSYWCSMWVLFNFGRNLASRPSL